MLEINGKPIDTYIEILEGNAKTPLERLKEISELAQEPYSLPCGAECKYPNCKDKITDNGKNCMELKLMKIKKLALS